MDLTILFLEITTEQRKFHPTTFLSEIIEHCMCLDNTELSKVIFVPFKLKKYIY